MDYLEIIFSLLILFIPLYAVVSKNLIPAYSVLLIGANPYVSAFSLVSALLIRANHLLKPKVNKSILFLFLLWFGYGLALSIKGFTITFFSELFQLFLAFSLLIYIVNYASNFRSLKQILTGLIFSGVLLASFEIIISIFNLEIRTLSYIGNNPANYSAFFLLITTIAIPLYLYKSIFLRILIGSLGFWAIYMNESRSVMVLSFVVIIMWLLKDRSFFTKILLGIVGGYIAYILFSAVVMSQIYDTSSIFSLLNYENNFSNLERLNLLFYSYDLFLAKPEGHGIGSSYSLFINNSYTIVDTYPHPHNTLAFFAVELGLIGIIIYFYLFLTLFLTAQKISNKKLKELSMCLILALAFFSIADVIFYNGILMLSSFIFIGIIFASARIKSTC